MNSDTIILTNLGSPTAPTAEAVRSFLAEFLADPMVVDLPRWLWLPILHGIILRRRPRRVAAAYRSIWTAEGSPLRVETSALGTMLAEKANLPVLCAYRYGSPGLTQQMDRAWDGGAKGITVLPLFPQRTGSSQGTIKHAALCHAQQKKMSPTLKVAHLAPDNPGYIEALVATFNDTFQGKETPEHLVLSFHGIPCRYDKREGGIYQADCQRTCRTFLTAIDWPMERATLTWQSRMGPERWLTPSTKKVLTDLPGNGIRRVGVMAPGFLTSGLETSLELGVEGRNIFMQAGGSDFTLVPTPGSRPELAEGLVSAILLD